MAMVKNWTEDALRSRLQVFHTTEYSWKNMAKFPRLASARKAAVLIPLVLKNGAIHVWLTKRASHLKNDGGDVAFPGGMRDEEDEDETATCLREAEEEIGLHKHQVKVICQLLPRVNRRQILITPIIGLVDASFIPNPNPDEVGDAFLLPLERFLAQDNRKAADFTNRGITFVVHWFTDFVDGKKFVTWGLTADICVQVAICVFQVQPQFEWDASGKNSVKDPFVLQRIYVETFARDLGVPWEEKMVSKL